MMQSVEVLRLGFICLGMRFQRWIAINQNVRKTNWILTAVLLRLKSTYLTNTSWSQNMVLSIYTEKAPDEGRW